MSEIEKMYENAGIKPTKNWQSCLDCKLKTETRYDDWGEEYLTCNRLERPEKCSDAKEYYPIFTAEKQIELIKLLGSIRDYTVEIDKFKGIYYVGCREAGSNNKHWGSHNLFEEAIAELVNDLWQYLSEEEKQQVKGILE